MLFFDARCDNEFSTDELFDLYYAELRGSRYMLLECLSEPPVRRDSTLRKLRRRRELRKKRVRHPNLARGRRPFSVMGDRMHKARRDARAAALQEAIEDDLREQMDFDFDDALFLDNDMEMLFRFDDDCISVWLDPTYDESVDYERIDLLLNIG